MSSSANSSSHTPKKIMVFRPTLEEMRDFASYVYYMETQGAHRAGVAKIIPPKEWFASRNYDKVFDITVPAPISQLMTGGGGLYTQYNIQKKPMTVADLRKMAESDRYMTPRHRDYDELERKYWKNLTYNPPIYGADISGSVYDPDATIWNINSLKTILDVVENEQGIKIEGVNTAYLYFGMWKSTFAWHTEDMDLYSINYVHFGAPKSWYAIPPEHGKRLERLAAGFFPSSSQNCQNFLRHKMTLISPTILKQYSIPYDKITQEAGEFMITFPYGYHSGFNHGFNCAESTNFGSMRWIDYGKRATQCLCRRDNVRIHMDPFIRIFQPSKYAAWKAGKDVPNLEDLVVQEVTKKMSPPKYKSWMTASELKHDSSPSSTSSKHPSPKTSSAGKSRKPKAVVAGASSAAAALSVSPRKSLKFEAETRPPHLSTGWGSGDGPEQTTSQAAEGSKKNKKKRKLAPAPQTPEPTVGDRVPKEDGGGDAAPRPGQGPQPPKKKKKKPTATKSTEDESRTVDVETVERSPKMGEGGAVIRRHPFSKPPKSTIPVTKQGPSLTQETAAGGVEEALEPWAKALSGLWISQPANFEVEQRYNAAMALRRPHCSVCWLFTNRTPAGEGASTSSASLELERMAERLPAPTRSQVLLPEVCFASSSDNPSPMNGNEFVGRDLMSNVLQCVSCNVAVHESCYGERASSPGHWECSRCTTEAWNATCCLCMLRGGAFKETTDGRWAHLVCAVALPEACFENAATRSPVDVTKIVPARLKLKCGFCQPISRRSGGGQQGVCIQCTSGKCALSFHTTCGLSAGVMMEAGDWPYSVDVQCLRHTANREQPKQERTLSELAVGTRVVCKYKNRRYYLAEVVARLQKTFYRVNFDDGSFSDNLFPQDIESRDCLRRGPPAAAERVQVRWTDGRLYQGAYRGCSTVTEYRVEFENGDTATTKRENLYLPNEHLPKKVRSKMSTASDMRHDFFYKDPVIEEKHRNVFSRYATSTVNALSDDQDHPHPHRDHSHSPAK